MALRAASESLWMTDSGMELPNAWNALVLGIVHLMRLAHIPMEREASLTVAKRPLLPIQSPDVVARVSVGQVKEGTTRAPPQRADRC